jgi:PAS domain S-box-containing protein
MRIQTKIIGAAMLVVAAVNAIYAGYLISGERTNALARLQSVIADNDRLLKIVTVGPLYDGNIEQLDATLDSFFANKDIIRIELQEYTGNIRMYRARTERPAGESIASRVVITRSSDQLGEIRLTYSTARIEEALQARRSEILFFSGMLALGLSGIIFLLVKGLTRPIERLTIAAQDMANGHLDREIDTRGAEELHILGQSFIRMRNAIRGKIEDLAAQNEAMKLKDQAIASSIDGIAIANPDGVITYVNTAFLRLWGYDREAEVLGKSVTDFWINREEAAGVMASVVARGGSMGELVAGRRDGSPFFVEYSASLVKDSFGSVTHMMGSFVDITGRKQAENELRTAHTLLQGVINATQDLIFVKDTNLTYLACNKAFADHIGHPANQIVGHDDAEWFPDQKVLESFRTWDRKVLAEGKQHYIEEWVTYSDGRRVPLETLKSPFYSSDGRLLGLIGVSRDITERKRVEDALRESRNLLQTVLDTIPVRVFWKDRDLRYIGCNQPFALDAGVNSPDEMVGKDDYQMGWREQADLYRSDDRRVLESGKPKLHYEEPQTTPDGRRMWLRTNKVPLQNADGTIWGILGTYEDITEYKQAEESLRQAGLIVENSPVMLFRWKAVEGWPMVLVSQNVVQLGYTPKELLDGSVLFTSMVHPDDLERIGREVQTFTASGVERFPQEYRLITKDGRVRWVDDRTMVERDDAGRVTHYQGIVVDITERKRVEQALVKEKAFSDTVIDSLPGVFYICDEQGLLLRWNDNERVLSGYSQEELSQMSMHRLFPHDRALLEAHMREVLETGRASVEVSIVTREGTPIPFYLTGFRMVTDGKRYLVGVGIDISERKRLEQQLLHAQKMESIGLLAGGIAHDFNNILAAIVGYGDILQRKMPSADPSREYVSHILASAERAASLTQSLLAFSRKQVISPKDIDLDESISRVEKFLTRIIGEDIALSTTLSEEALMIYADVTQIEQVLMNLVTNARDAMPKGGRIMIETGRVVFGDEDIRTRGYGTPGPYAVLSVSDTGEGMDEQTQKRIFEPFFTTKELGRGTGLGLAIVYGIVKQNNGYINVYSEPGRGTTFKLYFPLVSSRAGEGLHPEVQQQLRGGTETILFAEDNQTLRQLTGDVLQEYGYTVIEAADGEEALQKFQEHRERISLVILDIIMPKKNGKEVFGEARRSKPNVKVIFTSGYPADLIQKDGVLEKGLHFLSKPSTPQALLRKVREVLDQEHGDP